MLEQLAKILIVNSLPQLESVICGVKKTLGVALVAGCRGKIKV